MGTKISKNENIVPLENQKEGLEKSQFSSEKVQFSGFPAEKFLDGSIKIKFPKSLGNNSPVYIPEDPLSFSSGNINGKIQVPYGLTKSKNPFAVLVKGDKNMIKTLEFKMISGISYSGEVFCEFRKSVVKNSVHKGECLLWLHGAGIISHKYPNFTINYIGNFVKDTLRGDIKIIRENEGLNETVFTGKKFSSLGYEGQYVTPDGIMMSGKFDNGILCEGVMMQGDNITTCRKCSGFVVYEKFLQEKYVRIKWIDLQLRKVIKLQIITLKTPATQATYAQNLHENILESRTVQKNSNEFFDLVVSLPRSMEEYLNFTILIAQYLMTEIDKCFVPRFSIYEII